VAQVAAVADATATAAGDPAPASRLGAFSSTKLTDVYLLLAAFDAACIVLAYGTWFRPGTFDRLLRKQPETNRWSNRWTDTEAPGAWDGAWSLPGTAAPRLLRRACFGTATPARVRVKQ